MSVTQEPPSGWYADPENANGERFWSGTAWSEERRPLPATPHHAAAPEAALEARARELSRQLEPGEQMRAIGSFQSGGNWMELPKPTFFTMRNWLVGITDRRVILAKVGRLSGDLLPNEIFSVTRQDVVLKGRQLHVASRDRKVPKRLRIIPFAGFDKDEFNSALTS
jgi:hypothetical protein